MAKLMSIKEAAERLGISIFTVRRLIQRGQLPASKIGHQWRLDQDALELYIKSRSSWSGDIALSKLYFRPEVLNQYHQDARYYVQQDGSRGRLGLKQEQKTLHAFKSVQWAADKNKKYKSLEDAETRLFIELYFWQVKLKSGTDALMVNPKEFYRIPEAEQQKWANYLIPNPQV
ncbi:MAG: helix-turn-helix domain-containing protein [Candidatus Brocadiia bacterium]